MKKDSGLTFDTVDQMVEHIKLVQNGLKRTCLDGYTWSDNGVTQMWENWGHRSIFTVISIDGEGVERTTWEFDYNNELGSNNLNAPYKMALRVARNKD